MSGTGWASQGWEEVEDEMKKNPGGAGFSDVIRRFKVDVGSTRRFIVLADDPFAFWEHGTFGIPNVDMNTSIICLKSNGALAETHGNCAFCEASETFKETKGAKGRESWPSFGGYVTVIDCGDLVKTATGTILRGWVNDKGTEYNFERRLLKLNKGGKDKPGLLPKFRRAIEKKGGTLVGWVIDTTRSGKLEESAGTEWDFVGKVDVSTLEKLKASIKGLDGYRPDVHDKLVEGNVKTNAAIDYGEHFKVLSRKDQILVLAGHGKNLGGAAPAPENTAFDQKGQGQASDANPGSKADGYVAPDPGEVTEVNDSDIPF